MEISSLQHQQQQQQKSSAKNPPSTQLHFSAPVRSPSHNSLLLPSSRPAARLTEPPAPYQKATQHTTGTTGGTHIQVNGRAPQWNQPMSRFSLPASGIDERGLGFTFNQKTEPDSTESAPKSVTNKREFFEQLRRKSTDSTGQNSEPPSPVARVNPTAARHALALTLTNSTTELLPLGGHIAADSRFLHHALQTSTSAAKLLNDLRNGQNPSHSGAATMDNSPIRWNSDWQLHQSSSAVYRPNLSNSNQSINQQFVRFNTFE